VYDQKKSVAITPSCLSSPSILTTITLREEFVSLVLLAAMAYGNGAVENEEIFSGLAHVPVERRSSLFLFVFDLPYACQNKPLVAPGVRWMNKISATVTSQKVTITYLKNDGCIDYGQWCLCLVLNFGWYY
jgi:hypothetical protein